MEFVSDLVRKLKPYFAEMLDLWQMPPLPPPKVGVIYNSNMAEDAGTDRAGQALSSAARIWVMVEDMPEAYLQARYGLQLELLRIRKPACHKIPYGNRKTPRMFVHPTSCAADGSGLGVDNFGTRYGGHSGIAAARTTEWALAGVAHHHVVNLSVAEVCGPYFYRWLYTDDASGSVTALRYAGGGKSRGRQVGKRGFQASETRGVFAFRYSILDTANGRRVSSPASVEVQVMPRIPPSRARVVGAGNSRGRMLEVNPNADGVYVLEAKIGSRGGGR